MNILFVIQHYKLLYIMKTRNRDYMLSKDSSSSIIIFRAAASMFTVLAVAGVVNGQDIAGNETKKTMPAGTTVINGLCLEI